MAKPVVLFLCTGNSARSQMAEALLRHHAGDRFEVHSAGTEPKGLNPFTVRVMSEMGIDLAGHRSKHLREFDGLPVNLLIIVCGEADQTCPAAAWPGASRLFWKFEDPAACSGSDQEKLDRFRAIRDQIDRKIRDWLASAGGRADACPTR